ncbi:sigma-54 interaction domain-containing protein [Pelagibius marinus]|uniref:sigma-54 interaction domain-containing protein n=1 Tax=Pelagibius marinus TaxID=2762760 RepID=UPI00187281DC|nr:sigma 54-interacting transcriptional regulator [Pelagibius marinus]
MDAKEPSNNEGWRSEKIPGIHARAVESLFEVFETMCDGAISVDRNARIVWINEKYRSLLGVAEGDDVLGREIESVIPESLMREVVQSGNPIPVDIMRFGKRHFVVSRLPLHDAGGAVIGAVGFVLFDNLDYLKPLIGKFEKLHSKLTSMEAELVAARRTRYSIASIVGVSEAMVEIRRRARKVAPLASPVLLLGETGTGKELLAQSLHAASPRSQRSFVAVNMAAIPEGLVEAEFFGVAPGAYTGAERKGRRGKLELADGGTLFMDEIGDMPLQLQAKLLRVLEEQAIEPVGSNELRKVDVRLIAATSQDLTAKVEDGSFRRDLYYRLNVLPIHVPPLRDRLVDIRPLAELLLERIAAAHNTRVRELDSAAVLVLQDHAWPGNIRELRNLLEQACLETDEDVISSEIFLRLLPGARRAGAARHSAPSASPSLPQRLANLEREAIREALRCTKGKKAPAARLLGISRSTLYEKINELNLSDSRSLSDRDPDIPEIHN